MKNRYAIIFSLIVVLIIGLPITASLVLSAKKSFADASAKAEATEETQALAGGEGMEGVGFSEEESISQPETVLSTDAMEEPEIEPTPVPLPKYDPLLEINPYTAGWLAIDGTKIDAPVVYTPGSQNYFLHRALDGSYSERGTFFIAVDWEEGYNNTLIYGHNMKDGSGFGSLAKFADKNYGMSHPVIHFDTLYEDREYDLLAAFYSQIDEEELETEEDRADRDRMIAEKSIAKLEAEAAAKASSTAGSGSSQETSTEPEPVTEPEELTVAELDLTRDFAGEDIYRLEKDEDNGRFRYYYYTDLRDRDDFEYFVQNVKERALYDTGVTAEWGDDLLTLSTCSYHVRNGRFIVVAVRHKY